MYPQRQHARRNGSRRLSEGIAPDAVRQCVPVGPGRTVMLSRNNEMRPLLYVRLTLALCAAAAVLSGQATPRVFQPPPEQPPPAQPQPEQPQQQQQPAQAQQQPAQARADAAGTAAAPSGPPPARLTENGGFLLPNVSLTEMIDILAKRMKINY